MQRDVKERGGLSSFLRSFGVFGASEVKGFGVFANRLERERWFQQSFLRCLQRGWREKGAFSGVLRGFRVFAGSEGKHQGSRLKFKHFCEGFSKKKLKKSRTY